MQWAISDSWTIEGAAALLLFFLVGLPLGQALFFGLGMMIAAIDEFLTERHWRRIERDLRAALDNRRRTKG